MNARQPPLDGQDEELERLTAAEKIGSAQDDELEDVELANLKEENDKANHDHAVKDESPNNSTVVMAMALYAACSSSLLVVNKVSMHLIPDSSFVLFCQFLTSSLAVCGMKTIWPEMDVEFLRWEKVRPFGIATLVFFICLLSNTEALRSVNVETVIVVRSCSPIAVSIVEHLALRRALPSLKGAAALLSIACGACLYVMVDAGFQIRGYTWLMVYFVSIVTEMVFVKFIVDTVPMSTWTRVYYNNTLSLPMALLSARFMQDETMGFMRTEWTTGAMSILALSCAIAVAISYAGFHLRKLVSATSFTVVGVVCKIMTVLINDLIWTHHSTALGHLGLLICIGSGVVYEQVKGKK